MQRCLSYRSRYLHVPAPATVEVHAVGWPLSRGAGPAFEALRPELTPTPNLRGRFAVRSNTDRQAGDSGDNVGEGHRPEQRVRPGYSL